MSNEEILKLLEEQNRQLDKELLNAWTQLELPIGEVGPVDLIHEFNSESESEAERRKKEGLCPTCGVKGHFDRSLTMICPTHGPY